MTEPPRWWTVRAAQNLKPATYRCPFCDELLPALSEHVLVMPEGDARRRRHAHTACALAERQAGRLPARDEWLRTQPGQTNRRSAQSEKSCKSRLCPSSNSANGAKGLDGKEGVAASSPAEGFSEGTQKGPGTVGR